MEINKIYNMDCWDGLELLEDGSVDMILTDPPYSSGGAFANDRRSRTGAKYGDDEYNGASRQPEEPETPAQDNDEEGWME